MRGQKRGFPQRRAIKAGRGRRSPQKSTEEVPKWPADRRIPALFGRKENIVFWACWMPAARGKGFFMSDRVQFLFTGTAARNAFRCPTARPATVGALSGPRLATDTGHPAEGIAHGTPVLTLRGAVAVQDLIPGERIITRDRGPCALRTISHRDTTEGLVQVAPGALGQDRPDAPTWLPETQTVLLRNWRAEAQFGKPHILVSAGRLVDGAGMTRAEPKAPMRLYTLMFDAPHVIYAAGIEVLSAQIAPDPA
jgi:hypothetical protein